MVILCDSQLLNFRSVYTQIIPDKYQSKMSTLLTSPTVGEGSLECGKVDFNRQMIICSCSGKPIPGESLVLWKGMMTSGLTLTFVPWWLFLFQAWEGCPQAKPWKVMVLSSRCELSSMHQSPKPCEGLLKWTGESLSHVGYFLFSGRSWHVYGGTLF